jgi:hypothetical protein
MPNWKRLVREHLASLKLSRDSQEDVIAELSAHLEETYEAARAQGLDEAEAVKRALQEAGDWHVLAENIFRTKEQSMNHRTRSLWLPGLASFAAASLFLLVLTQVSLQPRFLVRLNSGIGISFYIGWLFAQVLFGALGAFLSRRAGGTRTARIVAATFPAIVVFGLWAIWIPASAFIEHNTFMLNHPLYYALGIFPWVVLPGIILLLGAAPFLKEPKRNSVSG